MDTDIGPNGHGKLISEARHFSYLIQVAFIVPRVYIHVYALAQTNIPVQPWAEKWIGSTMDFWCSIRFMYSLSCFDNSNWHKVVLLRTS